MQGKLLKVSQVALWLNVHKDTVYRLIKAGALTSVQVSERGTRISKASVSSYLASQPQQNTDD